MVADVVEGGCPVVDEGGDGAGYDEEEGEVEEHVEGAVGCHF